MWVSIPTLVLGVAFFVLFGARRAKMGTVIQWLLLADAALPIAARFDWHSALSCALFVAAGTTSGELIVHGYEVLGGISAAIAFMALPQTLAILLAFLFLRMIRPGANQRAM